jgi:hypothetical protein
MHKWSCKGVNKRWQKRKQASLPHLLLRHRQAFLLLRLVLLLQQPHLHPQTLLFLGLS